MEGKDGFSGFADQGMPVDPGGKGAGKQKIRGETLSTMEEAKCMYGYLGDVVRLKGGFTF